MAFENRHYVIFDVTELNLIDFNEVLETSADTVRKSIDDTKTFVKYEGTMPDSVAALTSKSQEYTHDEILSILSTSEWTTQSQEI
jgi:DNA polymerase III alpha subunit (gram-positive type)